MIRKNLNICKGHRSNPNIERNAVKYWGWGVIFINSFMMNLLCSLQKWRNSRSWINILWLKMVINNETYWKPPQLFSILSTPPQLECLWKTISFMAAGRKYIGYWYMIVKTSESLVCIHTVLLLAFTISKGHSEVGVYSIIVRCAAFFFFSYKVP